MKAIFITSVVLLHVTFAYAKGPAPCATRAAESKLEGPALKAFMVKCEWDARSSCDAAAKEKNLDTVALEPFTTKCMRDAVGH
jgi:hypothetical protein